MKAYSQPKIDVMAVRLDGAICTSPMKEGPSGEPDLAPVRRLYV